MTNTEPETAAPERLDPPPPPPADLTQFREWLADYCEVGDPATALIHFRHLKEVATELLAGLSVLQGEVVNGFPVGTHHVSGVGAFTVRRGAKKWKVAKVSDDDPAEYRRLLRDVVAKVPEGEDPLPIFEKVWPMGPGDCRWTAVKELGLNPRDYREADGWKHTIELL